MFKWFFFFLGRTAVAHNSSLIKFQHFAKKFRFGKWNDLFLPILTIDSALIYRLVYCFTKKKHLRVLLKPESSQMKYALKSLCKIILSSSKSRKSTTRSGNQLTGNLANWRKLPLIPLLERDFPFKYFPFFPLWSIIQHNSPVFIREKLQSEAKE